MGQAQQLREPAVLILKGTERVRLSVFDRLEVAGSPPWPTLQQIGPSGEKPGDTLGGITWHEALVYLLQPIQHVSR